MRAIIPLQSFSIAVPCSCLPSTVSRMSDPITFSRLIDSASGFSPVFSPQTGWTVNLTVNSDSPQSWAPGQTWTGSKIDPNNFLLQFECTSGDCSSTPITFGGATVSTQYAPDGYVIHHSKQGFES